MVRRAGPGRPRRLGQPARALPSERAGTDLMSSATTSSTTLKRRTAPADRRWLVLAVVAVAQLMLVLDATIVNIALPSAQQALGFSNSDRQWVVTAYALSFGSLLLPSRRRLDDLSEDERPGKAKASL